MKKQTKLIIICSVIALLLVVGCVLGFKFGFRAKPNITGALFECLPSEIISYTVDRGSEGVYTIVREKDVWRLENNDTAKIDRDKAEALIRCASKITATGTVKDVSPSELVSNTKKVIISLPDGETVKLEFFGKDQKECMFRISGDDVIYTMYTSTRDILTEPLDELMILDVFIGFDDGKNIPEFYEYKDYDKTTVSIRLKNGGESAKDDKNRFMMTKPYYRSADDEKFIQQIIVKIPQITRDGRYVSDKPDSLDIYGLDKENRATLTVGRDSVRQTLYLGKEEGGKVYACLADKTGVFTIKRAQLDFLNTEPFFLLDSRLFGNGFENFGRIYVSVSGETFDLRRNRMADGSEWFSRNGKTTNKETFAEIEDLFKEVEFVSELMTVPQNTRDIIIKIQNLTGTRSVNLILVPVGEKEYAVFENGTAEFAVDKQKINDIIDKIKQ